MDLSVNKKFKQKFRNMQENRYLNNDKYTNVGFIENELIIIYRYYRLSLDLNR